MESADLQTQKSRNSGTNIVFAGMAVLYVLICLCVGMAVFVSRNQIPGLREYFATATNTPVAHHPAKGDKIVQDDFSSNKNKWEGKSKIMDVAIKDGKLFLTSTVSGKFAAAQCGTCTKLTSPYYIQADFSTEHTTEERYGLAFSADTNALDDFYLFEINSSRQIYYLYKHKDQYEAWSLRSSKRVSGIKAYPDINVLAVSIDHDLITLYINGDKVDAYQDTGNIINSGAFWPYIGDAGVTLIVDNFYAYGK